MSARTQPTTADVRGPFRRVVRVKEVTPGRKVEFLSCDHPGQVVGRSGPATKRRCATCVGCDPVVDRVMKAGRQNALSRAELEERHLQEVEDWQHTDEARLVNAEAQRMRSCFRLVPTGPHVAGPPERAVGG